MASLLSRNHWLLVTPFLLLSAWLGMRQIDADLFWFDEMIQLRRSTGDVYGPVDFGVVLDRVRESRSWPPVHSVAAAAWGYFSGWTAFAVRYLSLAAGLLSVAWLYRLGHDLHSRRAGLYAAAMLSGSAFFLYYTHEFRGYTLYVLFSITSVWCYWRIRTRERHRNLMRLWLFVSLELLLHTHYGAAFTAFVIGLYHLLMVKERDRQWFITLVVIGAAAMAFVPWMMFALRGVVERELLEPRGLPPETIILEILRGFTNGLWWLAVPAMGYAIVKSDNDDRAMVFLMTWLLLGLIIMIALNEYIEFMFHIRHVIALIVPLILLIAVGLALVPVRFQLVTTGLLVVWLTMGAFYSRDYAFMEDLSTFYPPIRRASMDRALDTISACVADEDSVVFLGPEDNPATERLHGSVLAHTVGDAAPRYGQINNMLDMRAYTPGGPFLEFFDTYAEAFDNLIGDAAQVWVFGLAQPTPEHHFLPEFEQSLSRQYDYCGQVMDTPNLIAYTYSNSDTLTCDMLGTVTLRPCTAELIRTR